MVLLRAHATQLDNRPALVGLHSKREEQPAAGHVPQADGLHWDTRVPVQELSGNVQDG